MKIDYKILWLDNEIEAFIEDEFIPEIEEHLFAKGFNPIIVTTKNVTDFYSKLDDSYDLILTDFHLNDADGSQVIEEIRKADRSIFTEILFYTAKADLKDTDKISRVSFLETNKKTGSHQEVVISEIIKLINLTIKKFEHIVAIRGMIMHETSSLDIIMANLVKSFLDNPTNKDKIEDILKDIFSEIQVNAKEKYDKAVSNKTKIILKDNVLFNASQKVKALGKILKNLEMDDFSEDYENEIIWYRNKFAHAEIFKNEAGKDYFKVKVEGKDDELIFDEEMCGAIRRNIIKHKLNLNNFSTKLSS